MQSGSALIAHAHEAGRHTRHVHVLSGIRSIDSGKNLS